MPFDGTNGPFREPHRNGRQSSSRVQRAFRGWQPIEYCERGWRLTWKAAAFLRRLRSVCGCANRRLR